MSAIRCIGLELGGGKSGRTALMVLDYFPREKKIFLVDSQAQIQGDRQTTGDEVLLDELHRYKAKILAVNAPLSLPPCFTCKIPECPGYRSCDVPQVEWMRKEGERLGLRGLKAPTPYTQRPVDLAMRGHFQEFLPVDIPIDETLGAGPAPLAARFAYLERHLSDLELLEVNPRLVVASLMEWYSFTPRQLRRYRDIQEGLENRQQMLRELSGRSERGIPQLFLYEEDMEAIARELGLFDALISGLMAVFKEAELVAEMPQGFSRRWGTVVLPRRRERPMALTVGTADS